MKPFTTFFGLLLLLVAACSKDAATTPENGQSGSITRFTVHNGYMYALNPNEVLTYSLADADKPELVHRLPTDYGLETITVYDNTIFLGSRSALYILGLDNPAAPVILSQTGRDDVFVGGCDPVAVKDDYAYSTIKIIENICGNIASESALLVYDVRNKTAPVQVGNYPLNLPNGLGYADHYLFVCDEGADRLEVFDIANPLALEALPGAAVALPDPYDLIVQDQKMIVSTRTDFQIFDLSQLPYLQKIGSILK